MTRGIALAWTITLLACGGASEKDTLAPGCHELVAELSRCYPGREDLKESLTNSFLVAGKTDEEVKTAASRSVLKFEGGGSTGPDRKIGVLCPIGTANEKHCHKEARRPRQDRPSARFRCDGRGSRLAA